MTISVVMPVHNAGAFIERSLSSVGEALSTGDELIIVFDSCTDDTVAAFEGWRGLDRNRPFQIKTTDVWHESVALSRNEGMKIATQDWLGFIDHDDTVAPSIYRTLVRAAEEQGADVARCGYVRDERRGQESVFPDFAPDWYAFYGIFVWNSVFWRRMILENAIWFHAGYGEDYEFNLEIARCSRRQAFVTKAMYFWNLKGANQHRRRRPTDYFSRVVGLYQRNEIYLKQTPNARAALLHWIDAYSKHLDDLFPTQEVNDAFIENGLEAIVEALRGNAVSDATKFP